MVDILLDSMLSSYKESGHTLGDVHNFFTQFFDILGKRGIEMKHRFIAKNHWKEKSTAMASSDVVAASFDDCINLSIGDPDMVTDQRIIDAAFEDASNGYTGYPNFQGDPELRAEIINFYKKEYGIDVDDKEVLVTASGTSAMYLVMNAILDKGDEVILQGPYFSPYPQQVELNGGVPVELPTFENEDFQVNAERLESLITERTKAIVINSPNNPTGNCLNLATMEKILAIAQKYDLIVVSDEIYTSFSYQHPFIPFASLPGAKERTITINSFSKNFIMCGWRLGNIIAPDYMIRTLLSISQGVFFTAPSISQRAAIYALRHMDEIVPPVVAEFRKRMFYAADRVNALRNMHVLYPPKGSFYLWVNIKGTGLTSVEAQQLILNEAHVLMLPGVAFGDCGEGFLRIACTVDVDTFKEAFDRIEKIDIFNPNL